ELALPIELLWSNTDVKTSFTFKRFGIEGRYRLVSPDTTDVVPLVRLAAKRDVTVRDSLRVEGDAVTSVDVGALDALVDIGFIADIPASTRHTELRPSGGLSLRVTGELRLGAEVYSELSLDAHGESWALIGPNLAWTHGRFWLSGVFGIGLYHVKLAPRVMWGIAF